MDVKGVLFAASLFLISVFGCIHPTYNVKEDGQMPEPRPSVQQDNNTLVFIALSGGGTRAAAMSWKVLEVLKGIPFEYQVKGKKFSSNLAHEIDYISGISGGSFTAAAWCLFKKDMNHFNDIFIKRNIQAELIWGIFLPPWHLYKLISPYYDRMHMAAELYDETVFDKKTFGDLPSHPVLWINATDLALGRRFTYTKKCFDMLHSNLLKYPIGYACAASSAFPILLSPMTLINYEGSDDPGKEIKYQMAKRNRRKNVESDYYCKTRDFFNDKSNRYIHLADGGLVDNQGLQIIIDQFESNGIINKRLNDKNNPLKRLIIINVNAGVHQTDKSCQSEASPGVSSVIAYSMVTSMDRLSAKRWMRIRGLCNDVYKGVMDLRESTPSLSRLEKPYTIEINFRNIKSKSDREKCNKLPTSFYLKKAELNIISRVVPTLVNEAPEMIRLKKKLGNIK